MTVIVRLAAMTAMALACLSGCVAASSRTAVIDDPELAGFIGRAAQRLDPEIDLRIELRKAPGLRAQIDPQGKLTLWIDLLLRLADDSELAFVIAHELAHRQLHHSGAETEADAYLAREVAADTTAVQLLAQAGYDGNAGLRLMRALAEELHAAREPPPQSVVEQVDARIQALMPLDRPTPSAHSKTQAEWTALWRARRDQWIAQDPTQRDSARAAIVARHTGLDRSP